MSDQEEQNNSQGSEEIVQQEGSPVLSDVSQETEEKLNPAWNDMLDALPSSLHSIVTPHLKTWDKNYQDGINKVHSQYESYKPLLDAGVPKDRIEYALSVAQAIEERPEEMIKALQDFTGMSKAEATKVVEAEQGQVETEVPEELFQHPKFQEMEKMLQTVAQHLVTQKQQEAETEQDKKLASELQTLQETHGEYDEEYVLNWAMIHPDKTLEEAVVAYKEKLNELLTANRRAPAPKVLGQGGGSVRNEITKEDLHDPKTRKSVIAQMLQQSQST